MTPRASARATRGAVTKMKTKERVPSETRSGVGVSRDCTRRCERLAKGASLGVPPPPPSPPPGRRARSSDLLGVAHARGLCSLDELIAACRSSGESALAESWKCEAGGSRRTRGMARARGVKTTGASNPVLDTVLFRREELLERAAKCGRRWGEVIDARDVDVAAGAA